MGRRFGRMEQHEELLAKYLTNSAEKEQILMGMLVDEGTIMDPIVKKPRRKQGIVVQHPLDVIHHLDINENKNQLYSFATDWSCLEKEKKRTSLIREGSTRSSNGSRKSSVKSFRSSSTVRTTNSTKIRRNSGTFDGWNTRKTSRERKSSGNSQHKISISAQRDEILAAFYRNMERQIENESNSSGDSSDGETENNNRKNDINISEIDYTARTTEYVMKHAVDTSDISDEGVQSDVHFKRNLIRKNTIPESSKPELVGNSNQWKESLLKSKRTSKSSGFTNHSEINSKRLTELILDENTNGIPNKFDSLPRTRTRRTHSLPAIKKPLYNTTNMREIGTIQERQNRSRNLKKKNLRRHDSDVSISTDSARGSTHSVSSASSDGGYDCSRLNMHRPSVPMNFIPGYTSPQIVRQRNGSLPVSFTYFRKASFCFKGVTCRIFQNTPRTYRAIAHAGCVGLVIPAPGSHKCKQ